MLRDVKTAVRLALCNENDGRRNQPFFPVVLVENDCVIVAGTSLINAFDRLEVAEYSAKAIIAAKQLGNIVKISDDEIEKINKVFNLK